MDKMNKGVVLLLLYILVHGEDIKLSWMCIDYIMNMVSVLPGSFLPLFHHFITRPLSGSSHHSICFPTPI